METKDLSNKEKEQLICIARENIKTCLEGDTFQKPEDLPEIFNEKLGVFVTLTKNGNLRGCIGYPEPYMPLIDAVLDVSIAAAFEDPRFYPLSHEEFNQIKIEISVLTKPELVEVDTYKDYLSKLQVGRDGLIIENAYNRGLLLPQVPIEQNWDLETYLENLCYKAGLDKNSWKDESTKIYSFQALVFNEK